MTRVLAAGLLACLASGCLAFHQGPMPGEPAGATFAELEGARVRYLDTGGDGPPVVLIHGFASALETWAAVVPVLRERHRVIALDLKGFGWSDRPEGDYSPDAEARLVLALMDRLGVERAALVAHSWGSSVALALALRAPGRVSRLALYSAWVYEEQLPMFFHWSRLAGLGELLFGLYYNERPDERMALAFYDPAHLEQGLVDEVEAALERPGTRAAALAAARGQRFSEVEGRYPEVRAPTLLLWGREDAVSRLPAGERLQRELPLAELKVYPRCGHFPMLEAAAESSRDLVRFLEAGGGS
ncbi:MAG TPA: alpha/beta fold hydrolase [Myxococcota bacterium]|nr:alpha/beta fold hydrolase [Myxococcota bacterium]HRY95365.1 alpha/beta fold hydrolase [Myxococcota bacterium]HSA22496.1 alpha/beta fold hydrolase [Myxococcota bacterium]